MSVLLETTKITKAYTPTAGIFDVSFKVSEGEVVGFVGPNGAGKSTSMEGIMGFIRFDSGKVKLFGQSITSESARLEHLGKIGYVPAEKGLYQDLTAKETFKFASKLTADSSTLKNALKLADQLNIPINKPIKELSFGNRKKISIALAFMHKPQLIIMDEPTAGLDPLVQKELLTIIDQSRKEGAGILLSSHVLSEVEAICNRVIMIKSGKIVLEGNLQQIFANVQKQVRILNPDSDLLTKLRKVKGISLEVMGDYAIINAKDPLPAVKLLVENQVKDFFVERPTLESIFINYY